jgi:hypothetical protein
MILPDTSTWIDHLRRGNAVLADLLESGDVICHPFVILDAPLARAATHLSALFHL